MNHPALLNILCYLYQHLTVSVTVYLYLDNKLTYNVKVI